MIVAALMGFASGLPLLITLTLLQAWLTENHLSLDAIGLFALITLPYSFEFVAGPFIDRYTPPWLGRRRGWLLAVQLLLAGAIAGLGLTNPHKDLMLVAVVALLVALFSAIQDTVINAYRRESLADDEQGLGASMYIWGYRIGMLVASGGGLIMADYIGFRATFAILGLFMLPGILTTLFAPEPNAQAAPPPSLREAVVGPFVEFFTQRRNVVLILLFIVLYKLGDTLALTMTTPFYLQLGFSTAQIGAVVKLFGFWAVVLGGVLGGMAIMRIGQYRALWWFGLLQALSTAGFAWLVHTGPSISWLAVVIAAENFTGGMGTAAFVGFMANLTNREFTATQYALLASLMSVPRTFLASSTGFMATALGWTWFFIVCALLAIPGLLLLTRFRGWLRDAPPASVTPSSGQVRQ
ncbi:AmpG family muropeptide MFS transporter [Acidihalobacter ferrooxydans]|uniref:AmpG family muropeptide MFS transporter n=2 Tax=Acidihalobacter ferrooxydans TaxID=1765967 RepID=A0A1P8UKT6_9GAMM|nr:AmpG family muropeptide MFS transporter [Acidihalobacter ferrooxydans]